MFKIFRILIVLLLCVSAFSCKKASQCPSEVTTNTNAYKNAIKYKNGTRTVLFVGMQHLALPEFFTNVAKLVDSVKAKNGYLFYELIDDSNVTDTDLRKFRKFIGILPSANNYAVTYPACTEIGMVGQDNKLFLQTKGGINNFNADYTLGKMIETYETKYGKIVLTEKDKSTPLSQSTPDILPTDNVNYVIVDARNENLARFINSTAYNDIIVTYGSNHKDGVLRELQKLDAKWKAE